MKLLITSTSYPPAIGGAQTHTHQIAQRVATRHAVRVVSHWAEHRTDWLLGTTLRAPAPRPPYEVDGIPVHPITLTPAERLRLAPWVMGYYALKGSAIERIAATLAPKLLPHAREAELIHNARIGREGLSYASLRVARQLDRPFVFVPYHHPRWVGWNYREYLALYREADALIALTEAEKRTLIGLGVREERIWVTGSAPVLAEEADAARARARWGLAEGPMVLFIGQQYRYKGVAALLEAAPLLWARFPETRFLFIGPRTRFAERRFASVRDPRLINLGKVSLQEKTDLLAAATLLCVPSSQESFGGIYTEAWSLGKPVIGGDIPAVREVIDEGENGFVAAQEPAVLAERIAWLLDHPGEAAAMGERGRAKVAARYTWERLAALTEGVYRALLGGQT